MSHLHIPDGVLPVWLWLSGLAAALCLIFAAIYMQRKTDIKKQVPLLGMMSAVMLVSMNLEIVPIAYHVNLSVITGILIGPWLGIIAAFIVNIVLALIGHGGVTVVGLNTIVIGFEAVAGFSLFRLLKKIMPKGPAAGVATFITLFLSTCLMLAIVAVANLDFVSNNLHGLHDVVESKTADFLGLKYNFPTRFDFKFFATVALAAGSVGWVIESFVTALAVRFISRVKPGMLE